jgi:hypothetical protein
MMNCNPLPPNGKLPNPTPVRVLAASPDVSVMADT